MPDTVFILDPALVEDATALQARFGESAGLEATMRATRSRHVGNVIAFCRWRQVGRIVTMLETVETTGCIH